MDKVFIVTEKELQEHVVAKQQDILDYLTETILKNPDHNINELIGFVKQHATETSPTWVYMNRKQLDDLRLQQVPVEPAEEVTEVEPETVPAELPEETVPETSVEEPTVELEDEMEEAVPLKPRYTGLFRVASRFDRE